MDPAPQRLVPARMLNEFAYCPRLFHLEWVQGEFAHSEDTLKGALVHRRVDEESGSLPAPDELAPEDRIAARSVLLSSPDLGMIARLDLLEGAKGTVKPVDYKKGEPGPQGPWEPELVQLCAQGLLLRENGYHCEEGVLYFAATKQRVPVAFDDGLVARTRQLLTELREVGAQTVPPPPLVDSPKCPRCSLVGICLPDEVNLLRGISLGEVRRLVPGRDDIGLVYVVEQGASVGKAGERLVIRRHDGPAEQIRLLDVASLSLYGNVSISAQAIRALTEREIPILHHTYGGWLVAMTTGVAFRNVELRSRQYRFADDPAACLPLAQALVVGKIKNQRTLLRRNHRGDTQMVLRELSRLGVLAQRVASIDQLLGIEGLAAKAYFAHFAGMLREASEFDFRARVRRPPTDPVNSVLSFLYTLLTRDAVVALLGVGLDPYRGILHQLHYGRPSLALDLAEEFRALLAESVALTLLNNRVLGTGDFLQRGRAVALKDQARRTVIGAYEERMDTVIQHPLFGYSVSYRRILGVQARLLARTISGELPAYRAFTTR
ncbi:MAG TPA: CRISPR-associated endonuclease Cas1 [Candidatus Dormibacteraeota bacterium]|nr:CRISPR-associated endonuclease Cas1 [Candidatus Dormibacteraeota bacterium]